MRVREVFPNTKGHINSNPKKKAVMVRETLVPKMIQFEGGRLDGVG